MVFNLAALLIPKRIYKQNWGNNDDDKFRNLSKLLEVMKKSENKVAIKNGIRFLAYFGIFEELKKKERFFEKIVDFLIFVIRFDNDFDNLSNSLTFLDANLGILEKIFLKHEGLLAKLISLMRF